MIRSGSDVERVVTRSWMWVVVLALSGMLVGCGTPGSSGSAAASGASGSPAPALGGGGGDGGGGGGGGDNGGGGAGGGGGGNGGSGDQATPQPTAVPTQPSGPPYVVRKTENLGGETLTGIVCDTSRPFSVIVATPTVTFTEAFAPAGPASGSLSYAYAFPDLGESHDATGSYTISGPGPDNVLHLALTGHDHVVFNGFDGQVPVNYRFDLVPTALSDCPSP
jgi:hypothetical protein